MSARLLGTHPRVRVPVFFFFSLSFSFSFSLFLGELEGEVTGEVTGEVKGDSAAREREKGETGPRAAAASIGLTIGDLPEGIEEVPAEKDFLLLSRFRSCRGELGGDSV